MIRKPKKRGPGQPKMNAATKRNHVIKVRVNDAERAKIIARAGGEGNVARFMRDSAIRLFPGRSRTTERKNVLG